MRMIKRLLETFGVGTTLRMLVVAVLSRRALLH
jgi:hypothetical protein